MKKSYEQAKITITNFEVKDVILASDADVTIVTKPIDIVNENKAAELNSILFDFFHD